MNKLDSKQRFFPLILILAVVFIGGIIFFRMKKSNHETSGQIPCSKVQVIMEQDQQNTLKLVDKQAIIKMLQAFDLTKKSMNEISSKEIEHFLLEKNLFKSVDVYKLNSTLCVEVKQRIPLLLVQTDQDECYYVSKDKRAKKQKREDTFVYEEEEVFNPEDYIINFQADYQAIKLMLATGSVDKEFATSELIDLLETIKQDKRYHSFFGQIHKDPKEGVILVPKTVKTKIIFGFGTNWSEMLHKLLVFEQEVIARKSWKDFKSLRFDFNHQVVAKANKK